MCHAHKLQGINSDWVIRQIRIMFIPGFITIFNCTVLSLSTCISWPISFIGPITEHFSQSQRQAKWKHPKLCFPFNIYVLSAFYIPFYQQTIENIGPNKWWPHYEYLFPKPWHIKNSFRVLKHSQIARRSRQKCEFTPTALTILPRGYYWT